MRANEWRHHGEREPRGYQPEMGIKPLVLALVAACGVNPNNTEARQGPPAPGDQPFDAVDDPGDKQPPAEQPQEDQHFCCQDVKDGTGEDCVAIGKESINSCPNVLYCDGKWEKKDVKVTCLD